MALNNAMMTDQVLLHFTRAFLPSTQPGHYGTSLPKIGIAACVLDTVQEHSCPSRISPQTRGD